MRRFSGLLQRDAWTCSVALAACALTGLAGAAQQTSSGQLQILGPRALTVWVSANRDALEPRTIQAELAKDYSGLQVNFQTVPANNFVRSLAAAQQTRSLPDVVFVDNPRLIWQMINQQTAVEMLGQPRFKPSMGWWFLMPDSPHAELAKSFLVWLQKSPNWKAPISPTLGLTERDRTEISSIAGNAVSAMASGGDRDIPLDRDASVRLALDFGSYCGDTYAIANPSLEFLSGNGTIAYGTFSSEASADQSGSGTVACAGVIHTFVVLRKRPDGWKVLWLEPRIGILEAESYAGSFDGLGLVQARAAAPLAPSLIAPGDGTEQPLHPKQDFSWRQLAIHPAAYVIEAEGGALKDGKLEFASPEIQFLNPRDFGDVVQMPRPFGVAPEPYRWRVWAIGKDGQLAISPWRTVVFTE
jgi:hypothetical protein